MSFLGSALGSSAPVDMAQRKEQIIQQVRGEMALANAQELMNTTNEKCYLKCVTKVGPALSNSEQTCLSRCLERYMEAFSIVSRSYTSRLSRERMAANSGFEPL